jgi:exodeoxyribonuclease-5
MVNLAIWKDLMEYQIPIIAVGDHGQLPPVDDNFNLMETPKYLLTEIKRQALDNPIIRLSQDVRNGKEIPLGLYDKNCNTVFKGEWNNKNCQNFFHSLNFLKDNIIMLCGRNSTRVGFNQMIRDKLGYRRPEPYPGERIIFLKNNYTSKVLNGMLGKVLTLLYEGKDVYDMSVLPDDYEEPYSGLVYNGCFGRETYDHFYSDMKHPRYKKIIKNSRHSSIDVCDFGYCITTHKSQGSEFDKVIVFDEKDCWRNETYKRRWLYTAVTRAKEKLFIIK